MATLAAIKADPEAFLGDGGEPEDYQLFLDAIQLLMDAGMGEDEAVSLVWNDGEWIVVATAIIRDDWRPTHVITTPIYRSYVMLADNGALYTATEWALACNADYELDDDGTLLFQGQPALDATIRPLS